LRVPRLLVLGGGAILTACNLAPAYRPPRTETAPAYAETAQWHPAQPADTLPRGAWWERFGDPTLNELELKIDTANPNLAASIARYDEARAYALQSRAGLYPQVALGAGLSRNRQSDNRPLRTGASRSYYSSNEIDAQAGYEFDLWGKYRNTAVAGTALAQASAADFATIRLSLQAELAKDYFALRGLDADAQLLAQTVDAYRQARDLTQRLFDGKIVASIDVSRAQTQLDTAEAQASDIAANRAVMAYAIAALIGQQAESFSLVANPTQSALPDIPTGIPSELLQRRPDIAEAERNVKAANAQIGVARATFYPSVSLSLLGGTQSTGLDLLSIGNSFWSIGPNLSLPIFTGGALRAVESSAYARSREMNANYRAVVLNAFAEVEQNLALLAWLSKESASEESAVTAAQQTLIVALTLYREGAESYLEVVTAQTSLLLAQQAALDLHTRRLQADVALIRALGGGWNESELPSDREAIKLAPNSP
jgi:NodT family efflux transporter outer membrane factor (OMF) lipoprotein